MSLISGHSQSQSAYVPTLWAEVLHNAPHVNITLHPVDNMFNPENDLYLESIGILVSCCTHLPVLVHQAHMFLLSRPQSLLRG